MNSPAQKYVTSSFHFVLDMNCIPRVMPYAILVVREP